MDKDYLTIMAVFKNLFDKGLIEIDEYEEIKAEMDEKYKPNLSILVEI